MVETKPTAREREYRKWDELQAVMAVGFIAWTTVDALFSFTTFLGTWVDGWLRLAVGGCVAAGGGFMVGKTHGVLFGKGHEPPSGLVSTGLFGRLRHPLYAGVLLIYAGVVVMTFSLAGLALLVVYAIIYDKAAAFEEKVLERVLGEEYLAYKRMVPKWFPRLR
ncbi:MAG: isoprenylcysteine carboxylmethyltransferase family protein [Candidatus Lokiarchaeota archaeon]|nr:isoprenylcysteine carboxylmethyltransferase family protein [Candidatus Lokiarchaeota archaeon]